MIVYTTCVDCQQTLHHTGTNHHPTCKPKPTRADLIAADYINAILTNDTHTQNHCHQQLEQIRNQPPRLLQAALTYATWGWPVFPLHTHTKKPATRHGFKDATTNPDRITAWWTRHPTHNIGLPTGTHFDVIDIDLPEGWQSMTALNQTNLEIHGHVATSSGGAHYYITPTGHRNTARSAPGIDYRGQGGYVVAPPSTLGQPGRAWSWVTHPSPHIKQKATHH